MLDAGCGEGRFTYLASALGAAHVVAADYSREALRRAWRGTGNPPNVSFIRANIMQLPLAGRFDYVFSLGVLMMTPDARRAFHAVIRALAPGGYVTIFVYGRWTLPLAMWPLRSIGLRMSRERVLRWCNALGFGYDPSVRAVVPIGRALRRLGRLDPLGVGRITYEMLSAPYLSEHSRRAVAGWFAEAGVAPISATRMVSASGRLVGRREPRAGA